MDRKKTPLAVAIFIEVIYLLCALSVKLFPSFTKSFFQLWFHGLNFSSVWAPETATVGKIILGMLTSFVAAYIATWIFVLIYRAIVKK